jgi:hypothetical protein
MELTSVADDSLLRKLHGDFPQLCVEGEVGGGGASREVWVTEETDPYFGRGLNESQNASSLLSHRLESLFYTQFGFGSPNTSAVEDSL